MYRIAGSKHDDGLTDAESSEVETAREGWKWMDPVMLITLAGGLVGIVAGIVAVVQYVEQRREREQTPAKQPASVPVQPKLPIPNNLPPRSEFVGREQEKARTREALASRYPLVCIDGIGGIGKTSLALEVACQCLAASKSETPDADIPVFDGYIWVSAKDRELRLEDVLDAVARTLDYPGIAQQSLVDKQISVHKLLQLKRYLLVIDNFETVTDKAVHDFLLTLPEPSKALVTSRTQDLRQAWSVSLKGMDQAEALVLMRNEGRRLGLGSVAEAPDQDLLRLYQETGGAPLAIKWAIGQIKQKGQSLDTVLAYLYEARGDIFENIFARSWDLLDEQAKHVLMVMPFFATSTSKEAIEAASDLHRWDLDAALGQLVQLWLVEASEQIEADKRRYSIHSLTRSFSRAKLEDSAKWEQEARLRAARFFTDLALRNNGWGRREGFPWFELELANLLAVLDWAYDAGVWSVVVGLMRPMVYFLGTRGYWSERIVYGRKAVESARKLADLSSEAWYSLMVAWVLERQGDFSEAESWSLAAQDLMQTSGDKSHLYVALGILAGVARARNQLDEAERFARLALDNVEAAGSEGALYSSNALLGKIATDKGDYQEAERILNGALEGVTKLHDEERMGSRNIDLGYVKLLQGRDAEARDHFEIALSLSQKVGRQDNIGRALFGLAQVQAKTGLRQRALEFTKAANDIFSRLAMRREAAQSQELVQQLEKLARIS